MIYTNLITLINSLDGTTINKNCLGLDAKKYLLLTFISGPDYFDHVVVVVDIFRLGFKSKLLKMYKHTLKV